MSRITDHRPPTNDYGEHRPLIMANTVVSRGHYLLFRGHDGVIASDLVARFQLS